MATRRRVGGYVDREQLATIRRTNRAMVMVVRRMVSEQALSARMAQLCGRLSVELAEQSQAIGMMEQIRSER